MVEDDDINLPPMFTRFHLLDQLGWAAHCIDEKLLNHFKSEAAVEYLTNTQSYSLIPVYRHSVKEPMGMFYI